MTSLVLTRKAAKGQKDRGNLRSTGITPKIKRSFLAHYKNFKGVVLCDSERLFLTSKLRYSDDREYYIQTTESNNEYPFRLASRMGIEYKRGKINNIEIWQFGESTAWDKFERDRGLTESTGITFGNVQLSQILIDANMQDRDLYLTYDKTGAFSSFTYNHQLNDKESEIDTDLRDLEKSIKNPEGATFTAKNCSAQVSLQGTRLEYLLTRDGKAMDKISFPLALNPKSLLNQLVDPRILNDPLHTPPELDESWRFADLLKVAKINWTRY